MMLQSVSGIAVTRTTLPLTGSGFLRSRPLLNGKGLQTNLRLVLTYLNSSDVKLNKGEGNGPLLPAISVYNALQDTQCLFHTAGYSCICFNHW